MINHENKILKKKNSKTGFFYRQMFFKSPKLLLMSKIQKYQTEVKQLHVNEKIS